MQNYTLREIEARDNRGIEQVIRSCLIEFGANHAGTAWADPDLGRFSEIYVEEGCKYWVAEDETGKIVAGVGIGRLDGASDICELQKMYCLPEARGTGISRQLMDTALDYAGRYYRQVYLETMENMTAAQRMYKRYGFYRVPGPLGATGHYCCDVCLMKDL